MHGVTRKAPKSESQDAGTGGIFDTTPPRPTFWLMGTERMPVSEWLKLEACPYQRDTIRRAANAHHLKRFDDTHLRVAIARLPTGKTYKIDGHTRAHMWENGLTIGLPADMLLNVEVYYCVRNSEDSLGALYDRFDSQEAAQDTRDKTYSVCRAQEMSFKSRMLSSYSFMVALRRAYALVYGRNVDKVRKEVSVTTIIKYFQRELLQLDSTSPKGLDYPPSVFMTALLTFMRYGDEAKEFWTLYGENKGTHVAGTHNGVAAARNWLSAMRQDKLNTIACDRDNIGRFVNAFEYFRRGKTYTSKEGKPTSKDKKELDRYIEIARETKDRMR